MLRSHLRKRLDLERTSTASKEAGGQGGSRLPQDEGGNYGRMTSVFLRDSYAIISFTLFSPLTSS